MTRSRLRNLARAGAIIGVLLGFGGLATMAEEADITLTAAILLAGGWTAVGLGALAMFETTRLSVDAIDRSSQLLSDRIDQTASDLATLESLVRQLEEDYEAERHRTARNRSDIKALYERTAGGLDDIKALYKRTAGGLDDIKTLYSRTAGSRDDIERLYRRVDALVDVVKALQQTYDHRVISHRELQLATAVRRLRSQLSD